MTEPFQSISDVSRALDLPAHTLRYWERTFPAAIKPVTGAGGRRYYRAETVRTLERIKGLLYGNGYTIAGVKKLLSTGKPDEIATIPAAGHIIKTPASKPIAKECAPAEMLDLAELDRAVDLLTRAQRALV